MKLSLYSIRDKLVAYQQPFLQPSEPAAVRAFTMAVNASESNPVSQAYADMQLWYLGEWDDQTGVITSDVKFVCDGVSVKRFSSVSQEASESSSAVPVSQEASESPSAVPVSQEVPASPSESLTSDQLAYLSTLLKKKEVKAR